MKPERSLLGQHPTLLTKPDFMTNSRRLFLCSLIFFLILKITATMYCVLIQVSLLGSVINLLLMPPHTSKQAFRANFWASNMWRTQQPAACHQTRNQMGRKKARELLSKSFHSFFSPSVTSQTKIFPLRWHLKIVY